MRKTQFSIKDIELAENGKPAIERALKDMPVMNVINDRLGYQQAFKGVKIAICSHITKETAALCITCKNAGAEVVLTASNPDSTQDDVAASLVKHYGISVFGHSEQTPEQTKKYFGKMASFMPDLIHDDGAELLTMLYEKKSKALDNLRGTTEQTTSGVKKIMNMERNGLLRHPIIDVNSSKIKHLFDNRYGVGQTGTTTILELTNVLIPTENVVIVGYGPVGRGIANDMRGLGGHVTICEVDPIRALEAYMNGFTVTSIEQAVKEGTIFITATGSSDVIPIDLIKEMNSGAILANCGSGQTEFDFNGIEQLAESSEEIRPHVVKYNLPGGKYVTVLTEGRVTNIVGGEGNPSEIMDMSFSAVALSMEYLLKNKLENKIYVMPEELEEMIALIKLNEYDIKLSKRTDKQMKYDLDWHK